MRGPLHRVREWTMENVKNKSDIRKMTIAQAELTGCAAMGAPRTLTNLGSERWATSKSATEISHVDRLIKIQISQYVGTFSEIDPGVDEGSRKRDVQNGVQDAVSAQEEWPDDSAKYRLSGRPSLICASGPDTARRNSCARCFEICAINERDAT